VRAARRADRGPLAEFFAQGPQGPGPAEPMEPLLTAPMQRLVVATRGNEIVGACRFHVGTGRCAVITSPRMLAWDVPEASRLIRMAAAVLYTRDGAKLIQAVTEPEGNGPMARACELAGMDRLAVLAYLRREIRPADRSLPLPPDIEWLHYRRLRHGKFARTILQSYEDSLDCPKLSGLRTVDETIATHKHTGIFCPRAWHLALQGGQPAGVSVVNSLQGRGELVYLGVVPAARRHGVGRALVTRAILDTEAMGLPQIGLSADVANAPAMVLYDKMGFREVGRRLAYFYPAAEMETLGPA
jgi:ribosomal protein S18 acetylase RimI-like enzyme